MDSYSHRVIGWAYDSTLETDLPLAALRMALSRRCFGPGRVDHSDRAVQYAIVGFAYCWLRTAWKSRLVSLGLIPSFLACWARHNERDGGSL